MKTIDITLIWFWLSWADFSSMGFASVNCEELLSSNAKLSKELQKTLQKLGNKQKHKTIPVRILIKLQKDPVAAIRTLRKWVPASLQDKNNILHAILDNGMNPTLIPGAILGEQMESSLKELQAREFGWGLLPTKVGGTMDAPITDSFPAPSHQAIQSSKYFSSHYRTNERNRYSTLIEELANSWGLQGTLRSIESKYIEIDFLRPAIFEFSGNLEPQLIKELSEKTEVFSLDLKQTKTTPEKRIEEYAKGQFEFLKNRLTHEPAFRSFFESLEKIKTGNASEKPQEKPIGTKFSDLFNMAPMSDPLGTPIPRVAAVLLELELPEASHAIESKFYTSPFHNPFLDQALTELLSQGIRVYITSSTPKPALLLAAVGQTGDFLELTLKHSKIKSLQLMPATSAHAKTIYWILFKEYIGFGLL